MYVENLASLGEERYRGLPRSPQRVEEHKEAGGKGCLIH